MTPNGKESVCTCVSDEPLDFSLLDPIVKEFKGQKGAVIPLLQQVQKIYGYLPKPLLAEISKKTNIPLSHLYGVATFYAQFHLKRRGRHLVRICDGTACHVRGSDKIVEAVQDSLGLMPGQTSPDYKYTLEIVYCLGSCGLSPVALVGEKTYGRLVPEELVDRLSRLT